MGLKLPFGKHKGCSIERLPPQYLKWLSNQINTDLEHWAKLAKNELEKHQEHEDLEAIADDLLRQNGINPESL